MPRQRYRPSPSTACASQKEYCGERQYLLITFAGQAASHDLRPFYVQVTAKESPVAQLKIGEEVTKQQEFPVKKDNMHMEPRVQHTMISME